MSFLLAANAIVHGIVVARFGMQNNNQPFLVFMLVYAVLGSWIIGDTACGLGIREDINPVTHHTSRFVPHLIRN